MDLREFTALVGHARARRKSDGNTFVEFLVQENVGHLAGGFGIDGLAERNGFEKLLQRTGRSGVVHPLVEGFWVFDTTKNVHAIRMKQMHGGADVRDAELCNEEVGGQIAAHGNHQLGKLLQRSRLTFGLVQAGFGIVGGIEFVDGAVDQAVKLVADRQGILELELAFADLVKKLDEHGNFHGAGGVKGVVGVEEPFGFSIERAKGDGDVRAAFLNTPLDDRDRRC